MKRTLFVLVDVDLPDEEVPTKHYFAEMLTWFLETPPSSGGEKFLELANYRLSNVRVLEVTQRAEQLP